MAKHLTETKKKLVYHGIEFPNDPTIFSDAIMKALRLDYYEEEELRQLDYIIQDNEIILEVGGGVGLISTVCAKNPKTKSVTTYEANPKLVDFMARVHEINGVQVDVNNAILLPYPTAPSIDFYVRSDFWASSLSPEPWGYSSIVNVETRDFQGVIDDIKPTLLIVDIEGGESQLFGNIDLGSVRKVLIEVHQEALGRRGMKALFDQFSARNFHYDQWHSSSSVVMFSHVDRDHMG